MTELITALVALFFFGATMVYHDENRKLKRRILDEQATGANWKEACKVRDEMLAYWCNECIQLQRRLDKEFLERRRWEIEAQANMPRRYN